MSRAVAIRLTLQMVGAVFGMVLFLYLPFGPIVDEARKDVL